MAINIFEPQITTIKKGMEGKTILIYGSNRVGKTKNACSFSKPYYLPFEKGATFIKGIPFHKITTWADAKQIHRGLTNPKTLDKALEKYNTLIFDGVEMSALLCQDYICQKYDSENIAVGSVNSKTNNTDKAFGLWKEYEQEYAKFVSGLINCGYTVVFISHTGKRKENGIDRIYPKGDSRSIDTICNLVDIIAYAESMGLDENNQEITSTLHLVATHEYHAGSRLDNLPPHIEQWTAQKLEDAINVAIEKTDKEGIAVDESLVNNEPKEQLSYKDTLEKIGEIYVNKIADNENNQERFDEICEEYLGKNKRPSEATKRQVGLLHLILDDMINDFL